MKQEHKQVSQVFDNGRRGAPRTGCDCVVCFGYCLTDRDAIVRERSVRADRTGAQVDGFDTED